VGEGVKKGREQARVKGVVKTKEGTAATAAAAATGLL
jgi:hypothetical protein